MSDGWITESGAKGSIQIAYREDDWFLVEPSKDATVKCILQGEFGLPHDNAIQKIDIRITKYMQASGNGPDYLFVTSDEEKSSSRTDGVNDNSKSAAGSGGDTDDKLSLAALSGSGDYVTVEAIVDEILTVAKDESNMPDIIGVLREDDSAEKRMFVVNDGVRHPYMEENRRFIFRNVRDHYYDKKDKIQVMITSDTRFTQKDLVEPSSQSITTSSSSKSPSKTSSSQSTASTSDLDQIAESMIGEEEFTVTQDDESAISQAKKKAKREQRDPAIDPKLQGDE